MRLTRLRLVFFRQETFQLRQSLRASRHGRDVPGQRHAVVVFVALALLPHHKLAIEFAQGESIAIVPSAQAGTARMEVKLSPRFLARLA